MALGVSDFERTEKVAKAAAGKRLTYQRTRQEPEAEAPYRSSYRQRDHAASAAADPWQLSFRFDEPEEH